MPSGHRHTKIAHREEPAQWDSHNYYSEEAAHIDHEQFNNVQTWPEYSPSIDDQVNATPHNCYDSYDSQFLPKTTNVSHEGYHDAADEVDSNSRSVSSGGHFDMRLIDAAMSHNPRYGKMGVSWQPQEFNISREPGHYQTSLSAWSENWDPSNHDPTPVPNTRPDNPRDISIERQPWTCSQGLAFNQTFKNLNLIPDETLTDTYWVKKRQTSKPKSVWNPRALRNNCLYVSIGWLFGESADEIIGRMQAGLCSAQDDPVAMGDLPRILRSIGGLKMIAFAPDDNGIYSMRPKSQRQLAMKILTARGREHKTKPFALAYKRLNGSAHVVVAKKKPRCVGKDWDDFIFTDYQKISGGEDRAWDVSQSYLMCAIFRTFEDSDKELEMEYYDPPVNGVVRYTKFDVQQ